MRPSMSGRSSIDLHRLDLAGRQDGVHHGIRRGVDDFDRHRRGPAASRAAAGAGPLWRAIGLAAGRDPQEQEGECPSHGASLFEKSLRPRIASSRASDRRVTYRACTRPASASARLTWESSRSRMVLAPARYRISCIR